ncbi:hypothetical protein B0H19DRAFT_1056545 [Mycena capillaripes]|nr:hypothetical protein B0H19DRAFT_1056545 [Mycena capillaripes]
MKPVIQLLYTVPFPPASRSQLEYILSAASEHLEYEAVYDPTYQGLSPSDLFKCRNFSFSHNYALVADHRTLTELHSNVMATVEVVSVDKTTAMTEWDRYKGPGDLSLLAPFVRLALLRAMAEERITLDPHTKDWFWENPQAKEYGDNLWQVKIIRADPAGACYACLAYAVKDRNTMHAQFSSEAAKTGGVFRGLQ